MKLDKLLKTGLFSTALLGCGLLHGGPNFCPNCGQCLKPKCFPQRFGMPPPPPPCFGDKDSCIKDFKNDCKARDRYFTKRHRHLDKKPLEEPTPNATENK